MKVEVLEAIKRGGGSVPSMPQVVTRFLEIIQDPNFKYDELVTLLSTDPGTTSEILRLSNSALFGISRKVTSLKQAVTLLGPRRVRSLVLGRYMVDAIGKNGMGELDATYYWRRSLAAAVLAARFADKLVPRLREEAFIAALLADIGVTILALELPDQYRPIVNQYKPCGEVDISPAESSAVGVTHSDVSSAILEYWHLPELICQAVANSHNDIPATSESMQLARILWSADRIAKLLCESPELGRLAERCEQAMLFIQLDLTILSDMLDKVETDIAELAEVLKVDIIPSSIYKLIAKAMKDRIVSPIHA